MCKALCLLSQQILIRWQNTFSFSKVKHSAFLWGHKLFNFTIYSKHVQLLFQLFIIASPDGLYQLVPVCTLEDTIVIIFNVDDEVLIVRLRRLCQGLNL